MAMSDITITVPDDQLAKLNEKAARLGITLADLVLLSIEEILSQPDEDFAQAADYVLRKNAELYRRLA
jgi:hypothetical protein